MSEETAEALQPVRRVAASVVLWRRYGDLGQELRPGTMAYRGGARVYVVPADAIR
ncbi:hypothetical protein [Streptomyces sp. NPDC002187]|uniref:hypothetical protein n=1 Tax=Streptomyces sp. NPDC002187 TaxID=3364637 RepID=UPI00369CFA1B